MPQPNGAVIPDVKTEPVAAPTTESASTAVTPETPTVTTNSTTSSLMDKLGVPAEVQQELESRKPQPEPEPEVTAEAEAEAAEPQETPTNEEHSEEQHEAPKEWPESAKKRLAKERSKRGKAEEKAEQLSEENEQLRAQLESTQPVTVMPNSDDLLADVTSESQLEERKQMARATRDFYRGKLNGFTLGEGTQDERFVPPEEVATILGRVEDVLSEQIPKKVVQLRERIVYDEQAKQLYPDLFKPTSEAYQKKQIILKRFPFLVNDPGANVFIGHFLKGAQATAQEAAKAVKTGDPAADKILKAQVQTPPIAPHVPAAQRSNGSTPSRKNADQAMNNLAADGSTEALVAAIRARREAGNKTAGARELVSV